MGLKEDSGTYTAITDAYETIVHHTAKKAQVYMILRDVYVAFDKVWVKGPQFKISQLLLPNTITNLLNNIFANIKDKIR